MATRAVSLPRAGTRRFYVGLGLVVATIAFVGFWPTYFGPLLAGTVDKLPLIHFHAAVYVGWLLIFIAQAVLAARGRIDLHMKLGKVGIGYGVFVILVGLLVGFGMFVVRVQAGAVDEARGRLLGPLLDMAVFAPLFAAAVYYRRKPELHKRLMIVATTTLLIAAVSRMRFLGDPGNIGLVMLVWSAPILLAMGYDFAKRRVVHPVYVFGLVLLLLESPLVRRMVRDTDTWRSVTERLVTLVD
jgi:hypothetical protein